MAAAKLLVLYPTPKDLAAFERAYSAEHIPMAAPIFQAAGATKAVLTKILNAATRRAGISPHRRDSLPLYGSVAGLRRIAGWPRRHRACPQDFEWRPAHRHGRRRGSSQIRRRLSIQVAEVRAQQGLSAPSTRMRGIESPIRTRPIATTPAPTRLTSPPADR